MKLDIVVLRKQPTITIGVRSGQDSPSPIHVEHTQATPADLHDLRSDPDVAAASIAAPLHLHSPVLPVHPADAEATWGLDAIGATSCEYDGRGATIAVLDSGIDIEHEAFRPLRDRDALVVEDFTREGARDAMGHGTACASVAFGGDVGGRRIGVARGARALIAKVLDQSGGCTTARLVDAILWAAAKNADIVAMSLGFDFPAFVDQLIKAGANRKVAMAMALDTHRDTIELFTMLAHQQELLGRSMVFAAAAGNASDRDIAGHVLPAEPPAAAAPFLSVAALGRTARGTYRVASFSNGRARIAAPGVRIASAAAETGSGIIARDGTSLAVPHVAGVAALWHQHLRETRGGVARTTFVAEVAGSGTVHRVEPVGLSDIGKGVVQAPPPPELPER